MKSALDDLVVKFKEMIPKQEMIYALTNSSEVLSINEWVDFFDGITPVVADNGNLYWVLFCLELVWPAPKTLLF